MEWDRRGHLLQMMSLEGQEVPPSPSPGAFESVALGCPGLPISLWPICLLP